MIFPLLILILIPNCVFAFSEDDKVREWLKKVNDDGTRLSAKFSEAKWNYETNINEENRKNLMEIGNEFESHQKSLRAPLMNVDTSKIEDALIRRQIEQMREYSIDENLWNETSSSRERSVIT